MADLYWRAGFSCVVSCPRKYRFVFLHRQHLVRHICSACGDSPVPASSELEAFRALLGTLCFGVLRLLGTYASCPRTVSLLVERLIRPNPETDRSFVADCISVVIHIIQELCPMEPVRLPKFTSGRRDLNPGPPNSHPFSGLRSVRSE